MDDDCDACDGICKVLNAYIKCSKLRIRLLTQDEMTAIKNNKNNNK